MASAQKRFNVSRIVTTLIMMVLLPACSRDLNSATAGPKDNDMKATEIIIPNEILGPPIDLNTPAELATATFGLG